MIWLMKFVYTQMHIVGKYSSEAILCWSARSMERCNTKWIEKITCFDYVFWTCKGKPISWVLKGVLKGVLKVYTMVYGHKIC